MATVRLNIEVAKDKSGALQATVKDLENVEKQSKKTQTGLTEAFNVVNKEASGFASGLSNQLGSVGSVLEALGPAGMAAAAGFGAVAAGMTAMVDAAFGVAEYGDTMLKAQESTGLTTDALQELAHAATGADVPFDALTGALNKMQKSLVEGSPAFDQLGLNVKKLRDMAPDKAFEEIAHAITQIRDPAGQAAAAMAIFGKTGADLLPLMKSDMAGAREEAKELGLVMSRDMLEAGRALDDQTKKLGEQWKALKLDFGAAIVPALTTFLASVSEVLKGGQGVIEGVLDSWAQFKEGIGDSSWWNSTTSFVKELADAWKDLADSIPKTLPELNQPPPESAYIPGYGTTAKATMRGAAKSAQAMAAELYGGLPTIEPPGGKTFDPKAAEEAKKAAEEAKKATEEAEKAEIDRNIVIQKGLDEAAKSMREQAVAQDQLAQKEAFAANTQYKAALEQIDAASKLKEGYKEAADQITEDMIPAIAALTGLSEDAVRAMMGFPVVIDGASEAEKKAKDHADRWALSIQTVMGLASQLGGAFGGALTAVAQLGALFAKNEKGMSAWKGMSKGERIGAITGIAGGLGAAIGGTGGAAISGAASGVAAGAFAGPIGMVIGGIAGGIMGIFKKKKEEAIKAAQNAANEIDKAIANIGAGKGSAAAAAKITAMIPNLLKDKKTALDEFANLSSQFEQMQAQYKQGVIDAQVKGVQGLVGMINAVDPAASNATAELTRMGTYGAAMFETMRKNGMSFVDALQAMQPAIDAMREKMKGTDGEVKGAFGDLVKMSAYMKTHTEQAEKAAGMGDVIGALRHGGAITRQNLGDLSKDVISNVNAMRGGLGKGAAAGSAADTTAHQEALAANAKALYELKEASEQYGIALDAQTQAEIDAAEAGGLFEGMGDPLDDMKKSMDAMVQVLAAIATAFGATLPEAVQTYIDTLNKIPTPAPPPGGAPAATAPPGPPPPGGEPPHYAAGGLVTRPTYALVGEAGPELVVPLKAKSQISAAVASGLGSLAGPSSVNLGNLHINQQPGESAQELADRILATVVHGVRYNKGGLRTEMRYASEGR